MMKGLFAVLVVLGMAAPAVAETPPDKSPHTKKVCRTIANTGSRMPKRECRTQAEWDQKGNMTLLDVGNNLSTFSSRADLPR